MNKVSKKPVNGIDPELYNQITQFGARDMEICMQCGNCSASCPLSTGNNTFPRKIYRYIQLGLRDKLLASPEPWLCYYCGECNIDCPRGAEPAETMMATRRWMTTQYDWTGLAKKLYLSEAWEFGALGAVALSIILMFVFFHGPIITDRVAVNTFIPVLWIEIGDLAMAAVLSAFLLSNAFRMYRYIMADTKVPFRLYVTEAKTFILHFATQKRWRKCSENKTRWLKHFIMVTGYMTMMSLIIVFIRWFQVDDSSWHFSSIFGYYATATLLYVTVDMFLSRLKKKETIHRFSEPTDWLFLVLLILTTLTGILMHIVRLAGWPMGTYVIYVIHLAIAVPMLVIEVPFGKWSHMFYRPLAIFLTTIKEKAAKESIVDAELIKAQIGEAFFECMQCGTCSVVCPINQTASYSPRRILRQIMLNSGTEQTVDQAVWSCFTCNACNTNCPRGIDIIDIMRAVRSINIEHKKIPERVEIPLISLSQNGNPWNNFHQNRMEWTKGLDIPDINSEHEYCLFTCCTTAYALNGSQGEIKDAHMLPLLMSYAGISFGTLGKDETCCGDPAHTLGDQKEASLLQEKNTRLFLEKGVQKIVTTSPHCYDAFNKHYPGLDKAIKIEHYIELLDRLVAKGQLVPTLETDQIITYHDPCYLGRHNGIYEAPRRIIEQIPGLTLVEMPNNKGKSLCCGGGGGNAWNTPLFEEHLGVIRIQEAMATGAEIIATACPFCIRKLDEAIQMLDVKNQIKVQDIAQLLYQSLEMNQAMNKEMTKEIKPSAHTEAISGLNQEVIHG